MAKKAIQKDVIVKLIVGAGQASPSPPVGPALGSKGVKSMDFCKVCLFVCVCGRVAFFWSCALRFHLLSTSLVFPLRAAFLRTRTLAS